MLSDERTSSQFIQPCMCPQLLVTVKSFSERKCAGFGPQRAKTLSGS